MNFFLIIIFVYLTSSFCGGQDNLSRNASTNNLISAVTLSEDGEEECPVCLEPLWDGKTDVISPACGHKALNKHHIHHTCLDGWTKIRANEPSCPTCRTSLIKKKIALSPDDKVTDQSIKTTKYRIFNRRLIKRDNVKPCFTFQCFGFLMKCYEPMASGNKNDPESDSDE